MLAIVDDFASSGMLIGRRASTNKRPPFKDCDLKSGVGQGTGGRESGDAAANDADSCCG